MFQIGQWCIGCQYLRETLNVLRKVGWCHRKLGGGGAIPLISAFYSPRATSAAHGGVHTWSCHSLQRCAKHWCPAFQAEPRQ